MDNLIFSLQQISLWTKSNSNVSLPALQRGLVWKPAQVELLWDSILRGFPIGSFMFSDITKGDGTTKYYLMDGQQRFNAISLGFNTVDHARSVLWLDLNPPTTKASTRTYWIKATTIPQPWGFKNNDACDRLNTAEKREALSLFHLKGNIFNTDFSLKQTWPVEANLPMPLYCLLHADLESPDSFLESSLGNFYRSDFIFKELFKEKVTKKDKEYIKTTLYPSIKAIKNYRINCNLLTKEVLENETSNDDTEQTTLEVLFTRLNVGGTTISREDLNYSAIKAYWPSIKEENDRLAEKYMSPSKLVMLAFRLVLTDDSKDKGFKNELNIKQIRATSYNKDYRDKIERFYSSHELEKILNMIDKWLCCDSVSPGSIPKVLRTSISKDSPDVYLLLMYFAHKKYQGNEMNLRDSEIRALAFLLHWFGNDKHSCVQNVYSYCKEGINLVNICLAISKSLHECQLLHTYSTEEIKGFVNISTNPQWNIYNNVPGPAKEFFGRVFNGWESCAKEMLLYAERDYINSHFCKYDPARLDMWEEYNRPWDFDHIIPQNRISGKRGEFRDYDKQWLWSIGNFAAISLEANRSKSDGTDYTEYESNKDSLLFDKKTESISQGDNAINWFTYNEEYAKAFAEITFDRFLRIYNCIYNLVKPIVQQDSLYELAERRKNVFEEIHNILPESMVTFAASDGIDYPLERKQDWSRQWMGIGIKIKDFFVCYEWIGNNQGELGIRKAPLTIINSENMKLIKTSNNEDNPVNEWWYTFDEDVSEDKTNNANYIVNRLCEIRSNIIE